MCAESYPDTVRSNFVHRGGKSIFESLGDDSDEDADGVFLEKFVPNCWGLTLPGGDADAGASEGGGSGTTGGASARRAPVCYVGEGNNHKTVIGVLEKRGFRVLPFDASYTTRFDLKWVEQRGKIDYSRHLDGQLVNHIPNNTVITNKTTMLATMRAHTEKTGQDLGIISLCLSTFNGECPWRSYDVGCRRVLGPPLGRHNTRILHEDDSALSL